ncbi:MAG: LLM class flavin-dependent oxidoreductase [Deltaproteobacteria bacterium]|nr:LLM class flavin-dependent oxidoreductase [Deltaproteobacteria bacterium]
MANIGLCWVNPAPLTKGENLINFAKKTEAMGAHSMWTIDRIAYDNLEPLTLLAAAAGVTQRIRLGTSVLLGNTRHAAHLAKIVATIDYISNGRITLGLGFGSREPDYKAIEVPWDHRGTRAVEQVQLMKRLWTEDNVTHKGRFYNVENLTLGPKPIQKPHPPLWTGGSAETSLKRAGMWADGFISGSSAIADFHVTWDKIASYAVAAGRDPNKITKASLAFMAINDDKAKAIKAVEDYTTRYYGRVRTPVEPVSIVGGAEQCIDKIQYFLSKGLDTLIIGVADPDPRQLDLFGEKVLPKVKA